MFSFIWIYMILTTYTTICYAYWGTGTGQYHIQTDEGNERYFRYQTDNGQYRKEKRLQDGTVIGTDAWIDAAGFLRAKDYIADDQGYRILKSKTFYVGQGRNIQDAVQTFKNLPSNSITSSIPIHSNYVPVTTYRPTSVYSTSRTTTKTYPSYSTTTTSPLSIPPTIQQPISSTTYRPATSTIYSRPITSTTYRPVTSTTTTTTYKPPIPSTTTSYDDYNYLTPKVYIRHHSIPLEDNIYNSISNNDVTISSTPRPISIPSQTYLPPHYDKRIRQEQLKPIAISSSTPPPISINDIKYVSTTLLPPLSTSTYSNTPYHHHSTKTYDSNYPQISSTPATPSNYRSHSIDSIHHSVTSRPQYETSTISSIDNNDIHVRPLYSRQPIATIRGPHKFGAVQPLEYNNNLGSGYDPQFPSYDGISVNRNGFSYYLPKQYHEEDNLDPEHRRGSFGYIDPFGIRRVTYYNTAPGEGFIHRKNNRYVGHNATPYDPRPIQF